MNGSTELTEVIKTIPIEKVDTNIHLLDKCSCFEFINTVKYVFGNDAFLQIDYSTISNELIGLDWIINHSLDYNVYKFECYNNDDDKLVFKAYIEEK